jgi:iron complex outermembrane receptor protein
MVYFSYSQELSAPRTDDLYTVSISGSNVVSADSVRPETSTNYELGYRYQTARILGTLDVYKSTFQNRIVSTYDQDTGLYDDRNVGDVDFYGVEGQIGVKPITGLTLLGNFSYNHSELQQDLLYSPAKGATPAVYEPLKGKQLVETPEWMFGGRAQYEFGPATLGLQTKWVDKRWITDVNDLSVPSYMLWDADLRIKLDWISKGTYIQSNIINLFDKRYYGSLGTTASANTALPYGGSQPYAYQGAPRTWWTTLKVAF